MVAKAPSTGRSGRSGRTRTGRRGGATTTYQVTAEAASQATAEAPSEVTAEADEQWRSDVPEDEQGGGVRSELSPEAWSPSTITADPVSTGRRWRRLRTTLEIIRSNPTGRIALKGVVAVVGAVVVAVGIVLIPLPGPGWLLVFAGLGIWAIEYHWARQLLAYTRRQVHRWTQWVRRQSLATRAVAGLIGLIFVAAVVWLSLKYSLGIDVIADLLRYLATH